jgi:hypothetical protein
MLEGKGDAPMVLDVPSRLSYMLRPLSTDGILRGDKRRGELHRYTGAAGGRQTCEMNPEEE